MDYETLLTEQRGNVTLIRLNRPNELNAFNNVLMNELTVALKDAEASDDVHVIVLTGSEKAFAAGADIKEMNIKSYMDVYKEDFITANWEQVTKCRKPIIAAVAGYALGGGCELAIMCDIIIAADNAKFGQPEIKIGVMPGAGGTQRLTRAIGKSKAMEMVLTGRMMDAEEAEKCGLVSRVVPLDNMMEEVMMLADQIAAMSKPSVMLAKECVNYAYEASLNDGIRFERRIFHSLFGTDDQKEGMKAFIEKRPAQFKHK